MFYKSKTIELNSLVETYDIKKFQIEVQFDFWKKGSNLNHSWDIIVSINGSEKFTVKNDGRLQEAYKDMIIKTRQNYHLDTNQIPQEFIDDLFEKIPDVPAMVEASTIDPHNFLDYLDKCL